VSVGVRNEEQVGVLRSERALWKTSIRGTTKLTLFLRFARRSEKFAMQIFNEMPIAPIDTFLTSPMPNIIVSICWVLIFIIQMQHSHRMEVEATFFHRRSIEFMVHSSRL